MNDNYKAASVPTHLIHSQLQRSVRSDILEIPPRISHVSTDKGPCNVLYRQDHFQGRHVLLARSYSLLFRSLNYVGKRPEQKLR